MRYPFEFIPSGWWPRFFWPLLALTIVLIAVFGITGAPMTTEAAPYGIVSFELAGTVEKMESLLASWDANTRERAVFGLGLDYLFMLVYASTIVFGCGIAANVLRREKWLGAAAVNWVSWGVILAALLDVVENLALTVVMLGDNTTPWPEIARWCALPKFGLIFVGIVFVLYGGTVALVSHLTPK